jgi:hypothetical protein
MSDPKSKQDETPAVLPEELSEEGLSKVSGGTNADPKAIRAKLEIPQPPNLTAGRRLTNA